MKIWCIIALLTSEVLADGYTGPTVGTSLSWTSGPVMFVESRVWRKVYTPVIIGTIIVQVNEATNKTVTTTSYHSEYLDGTETVSTPRRVNAAGTRTAELYGGMPM